MPSRPTRDSLIERAIEQYDDIDKDEESFINDVMSTTRSPTSRSQGNTILPYIFIEVSQSLCCLLMLMGIADAYNQSRSAAMDEADMRSSFFRAAADAFQRGQPGVAAELAERVSFLYVLLFC
jgi:hypothetical protein